MQGDSGGQFKRTGTTRTLRPPTCSRSCHGISKPQGTIERGKTESSVIGMPARKADLAAMGMAAQHEIEAGMGSSRYTSGVCEIRIRNFWGIAEALLDVVHS